MLRNWSLNPLAKVAIGILRSYGTNAHVYLPGVGTLNGLTAGNYLDSAGTTAATVDNPVGLSLDALQAMTLGSELINSPTWSNGYTTNGAKQIPVGWQEYGAASVSSSTVLPNSYSFTATAHLAGIIGLLLIAGNTYKGRIIARKTAEVSGTPSLQFYLENTWTTVVPAGAAIGTWFTLEVNHKVTGPGFVISNFSGAASYEVQFCSVREIPGIRATQGTTANKPILRRGMLNQFTWSNDFTNAAHTKNHVSLATGQADPYGGALATTLIASAVSSTYKSVINAVATPVGAFTTFAIVKASGYTFAHCTITGSVGRCTFNLGTAASTDYGVATTRTTQDLGGGWLLLAVSSTGPGGSAVYWGPSNLQNDPAVAWTGDGTSGVTVYKIGMSSGTWTAAQILAEGGIPTTTATAASNPSAGKYWWQFDGTDSLSLSAPLFQMSDDHCVIAGANCTKTASWNTVFGQGGATATQRIQLGFDASTGYALYYLRDDAATSAQMTGGVDLRNQKVVLTAKKTGSTKVLRVNGVQQGATNNTVLGATTLTGGGIGAIAVASPYDYFQGSIYPVIAIKGTVTDSDLLTLERFVGQMAGVSI